MRQKHFIAIHVLLCFFLIVVGCDTPDNPTFGPNNPDPNPPGVSPAILTGISPETTLPGRTVTITGSGFNTDPSLNLVNFGNRVGTVLSATATQLEVELPFMSGNVGVRVAVKGSELWSNSLPFVFESFIPDNPNPEATIIDDTILWPNGIAVDNDDNVYIGSAANGIIHKIAPDGTMSDFASVPVNGAIHFGPQNYLYVCEKGEGTVVRISPDGATIEDVAFVPDVIDFDWDADGNMYLVSGDNGLYMMDNGGTVSELVTDLGSVKNCRVFDGYVYISKIWDSMISRFEIIPGGLGDEEVYFEADTPSSFEFDKNGVLYWAFAWGTSLNAYAPRGSEEAVLYEEELMTPMRYMLFHKDKLYIVFPGWGDVGQTMSVTMGVEQAPRYGRN